MNSYFACSLLIKHSEYLLVFRPIQVEFLLLLYFLIWVVLSCRQRCCICLFAVGILTLVRKEA